MFKSKTRCTLATILWISGCSGALNLNGVKEGAKESNSSQGPFVSTLNLNAAQARSYSIESDKLSFDGSQLNLQLAPLTDLDHSSAGFGGATLTSLVWDGTASKVKLAYAGRSYSASYYPTAGLIHYWPLDGNANDIIGTAHMSATSTAPDLSGGAFAGASALHISTANTGTLTGPSGYFNGGSFTFSLWVKPTAVATSPGEFFGVCGGAGDPCLRVGVVASGNFDVHFDADDLQATSLTVADTDNRWNHFVYVYDDTAHTQTLYVNGTRYTSGAINHTLVASSFTVGFTSTVPTFVGFVDEIAMWSTPLSAATIRELYLAQTGGRGSLTSRVLDAGEVTNFKSLELKSTLPSGKLLPGESQSESSADYSDLVGSGGLTTDNNLMSGNIFLMHLTDLDGDGAIDLTDASASHATVTCTAGQCPTISTDAVFQKSAQFTTASAASFTVADQPSLRASSAVSIALWAKLAPTSGQHWEYLVEKGANDVDDYSLFVNTAGLNTLSFECQDSNGIYHEVDSSLTLSSTEWTHVAVTLDGSRIRFYINGVLAENDPAAWTLDGNNSSPLFIGQQNFASTYVYEGKMNEVGIWNRVLHATEIQQLYLRGKNRFKVQVRSCATNPCIDGTDLWQGPDNSASTYFSDLDSASRALTVGASPVKLLFPSFSSLVLAPSAYFQYKVDFESDLIRSALAGPELKQVSVKAERNAALVTESPVSFDRLASFSENSTCPDGVHYQLSLDKTHWSYWNGSSWAAAAATRVYAEGNPASVINDHIATFSTSAGNLYVRALLHSAGESGCALSSMEISGIR